MHSWSILSFCHALSSRVNLKPREVASPISVPFLKPDLGVQYHPWSKVNILGWPPYPIQWKGPQGWGHLRANPGFGVFCFISPLLVIAYLPPTSFKGRIFSGLFGVDLFWVQTRLSVRYWRQGGVRAKTQHNVSCWETTFTLRTHA